MVANASVESFHNRSPGGMSEAPRCCDLSRSFLASVALYFSKTRRTSCDGDCRKPQPPFPRPREDSTEECLCSFASYPTKTIHIKLQAYIFDFVWETKYVHEVLFKLTLIVYRCSHALFHVAG